MPTIEGAGVPLRYEEHGPGPGAPAAGPTAIFVHDIAADGAGCASVASALVAAGLRAVTYDRRGYGESGAPEPYAATTVDEQGHDLEALVVAVGGGAPVLLVGEGFGALVALDLVLRRPGLVHGAVLSDAPLFAFVPSATEVLSRQRAEIEEALREGGPGAAVAAWLGDGADAERLARAQRATAGFFADYAGLASLAVTRRELREIAVPLAVVTAADASPPLQEAADRLAELVPGARRARDGEVVALARLLA
jgi:pimeloyl-ACP methyl ester carboxylesterase